MDYKYSQLQAKPAKIAKYICLFVAFFVKSEQMLFCSCFVLHWACTAVSVFKGLVVCVGAEVHRKPMAEEP